MTPSRAGRGSLKSPAVGHRRSAEPKGYDLRTQRFYLGEALGNAYLDRREWEVLNLILLGLTGREIALRLKLKPGTVSWYTDRIKQKLGCVRRSQLHGTVIRHGLAQALANAPNNHDR